MALDWATSWENLLMPYANNKDTAEPAHLRSLITIFIFKPLASLWSWAGLFESYLVTNSRRQVFLWRGSIEDQYLIVDCLFLYTLCLAILNNTVRVEVSNKLYNKIWSSNLDNNHFSLLVAMCEDFLMDLFFFLKIWMLAHAFW